MRNILKTAGTVFAAIVVMMLMPVLSSADDSSLPVIPVDAEVVASGTTKNYTYELYSNGMFYMTGFCVDGGSSTINLSDLDEDLLSQIDSIYFDVTEFDCNLHLIGDDACSPSLISLFSRSTHAFWNLSFDELPTVKNIDFSSEISAYRMFLSYVGISSVDDYADIVGYRLYIAACENIRSINIDSDFEELVVTNCSGILDIDISGSKIDSCCFSSCDSLRSVLLPKNSVCLYPDTFKNCYSIKSVSIPDSVKTIKKHAFYGCEITEIVIPAGVEKIEQNAFEMCGSLVNVYISSNTVQIAEDAFPSSNIKNVSFAGTEEEWKKIRVIKYSSTGYIDSDLSIDDLFAGATKRFNVKKGWNKVDGKWCYLNLLGERYKGWNKINDVWYYFDTDGFMVTGWKLLDSCWYYLDQSGKMATGWKQLDGSWYRFNSSGVMLKGWQCIDGTWYFFNDNGKMATGWVKDQSDWYYMDPGTGARVKGWKQISGKWYYLDPSNAKMSTGWRKIGSDWYYFESSGAMATGWKQLSGIWYYFKNSGAMAAGEYCEGYWLNPDGSWTYKHVASWHQDSKGWWFGDESGWYAKNRSLTIDGKSYSFNSNGYLC